MQVDYLLKNYGKDISAIIDFGCGTGRHDVELTKLGYQCVGFDISAFMIEMAIKNKKSDMNIDFFVADTRKFVPKKKYDAVISMFHVMSYQNENQDILETFHTARKSLNKDGLFLFDVWYGPGVLSNKPEVRVKTIEDDENRLVRIARPIMHDKKNIVDVCYEVFIINRHTDKVEVMNEVHSMRYFFRPELEFLLEEAGFRLMDNIDCKSLKETDYSSWTSYFIAKAI